MSYLSGMDRPATKRAIEEAGKNDQGIAPAIMLARRLEVTKASVYDWLKNGLSEERCYQLAHLSSVPLVKLLDERRRDTSGAAA